MNIASSYKFSKNTLLRVIVFTCQSRFFQTEPLNDATPALIIDKETKTEITNFRKITNNTIFGEGLFRGTSYEWGVTNAGMLLAGAEIMHLIKNNDLKLTIVHFNYWLNQKKSE